MSVVPWFRQLFAVITLGLGGCIVSPQPNPPSLDPQAVTVFVDPAGLMDSVMVRGGPGSVLPPEGAIVALNLDTAEPPTAEPVNEDGSFVAIVRVTGDDELRVQVRNGSARSAPFDFRFRTDGTIIPSERPLRDCLRVAPASELDLGTRSTASVAIDNGCSHPIAFLPSRIRGGGPFSVVTDVTALAAGESALLRVSAEPAPGAREEVLLIETSDPPGDRRPITLFARTTD
jgi:hypothetical protein